MSELEFATYPLELKGPGLKKGQFEGHGAVFGNIDLDGDIIVKGAFKKTLREHENNGTLPQMFWMHQADQVPGKWLEMREDDVGLFAKGELLPTTLGKDMKILLDAKAARGLSVGFITRDADWRADGVRVIKEIDLVETSLVSLAANPLAKVESVSKSVRLSAAGEYVPLPREFEKTLRDGGYSRRVAKQLTGKVFSELDAMSPDEDETLAVLSKALNRPWMETPASTLFDR